MPKLFYFPVRGRGEAIRLICADNGVQLEEESLTWETWPAMKPKTIFGQLPVLIDGDLELAQSYAIIRHFARKLGLYGSNDTEATLIDMINDGQEDLRIKYIRMIYDNYENGKAAYIQELPVYLAPLEKLLKKNHDGQGFFVGEKISFADYTIYDLLEAQVTLEPSSLDAFPALKSFRERIAARPGIQQYHQTEGFLKRPINGNGKQ